MIAPHDDKEPKNVNDALSGPKAKEWIKAMEEEMELMNSNKEIGRAHGLNSSHRP